MILNTSIFTDSGSCISQFIGTNTATSGLTCDSLSTIRLAKEKGVGTTSMFL